MKIDTNAFIDSLPIMGVGLLGIFIVTLVIIIGIYILKAVTPKSNKVTESEDSGESVTDSPDTKKESALDLLKEREKKDFLKEEESNYISHDL